MDRRSWLDLSSLELLPGPAERRRAARERRAATRPGSAFADAPDWGFGLQEDDEQPELAGHIGYEVPEGSEAPDVYDEYDGAREIAHAKPPRASRYAPDASAARHGARSPGERRTITITGRGTERYVLPPSSRSRPQQPLYERPGFRPDRVGLWALALCVLLVLVAAATAHAATIAAVVR